MEEAETSSSLLQAAPASGCKAGDDEPNTLQLLDGWHRLVKAMISGVEYLPAYLLTQEQSEVVIIAKLPPERGIDWGQNPKGGLHGR